VLLATGRTSLRIGSTKPLRVRDAEGVVHDLEAGTYSLGRGLRLPVDGEKAQPLVGPLMVSGAGGAITLDGAAYRGSLEVAVVDGKLRAINFVGLDAYLYGVVPREVPYNWPAEALKAQAVVARSYALAVRKTGAFDLFADTRSQVYGGIAAERPETTAAVTATAGQVVLYAGSVATTYFFSTSGGRTASIQDAWPRAQPVPYLVSVPDPHDSASPHHRWGPLPVTAARLVRALGAQGRLLDVRAAINRSNRVGVLTAVTPNGTASKSGDEVRTALGLRSAWFRVGMLALERPESAVVPYGTTAVLRGRARFMPGLSLEARSRGGAWTRAASVAIGRDGAFALSVKPLEFTEYRIASGTVRTGSVRLFVAPNVRLRLPRAPTELTGRVRPALPGAVAVLQRRAGAVWRVVARANIEDNGLFRARLRLSPGTYRARVAPGNGFVVGVSPPLDVVAP
jgi:stage II sporulation protein D